jgi:hypothetical protein
MRRKAPPPTNDDLANRLTSIALFFQVEQRHAAKRWCLEAAARLRELAPKAAPDQNDSANSVIGQS